MSDPYIGEVRLFGGNFAPQGWAFCNGQLLPISQNEALFALIGTTYGGDGQETFNLPDLQGRLPIHQGRGAGLSQYNIGQVGGSEQAALNGNQIPSHTHAVMATTNKGTMPSPGNTAVLATPVDTSHAPYLYVVPGTSQVSASAMNPSSLAPTGGSQSHENRMPALCVSFIIALQGVFPQQS